MAHSDHRGIVPISPRGEKSSANREKPQVAAIIVRLPRGPATCDVPTGPAAAACAPPLPSKTPPPERNPAATGTSVKAMTTRRRVPAWES